VAQSPAHRFGQIIGDALEVAVEPLLRRFAEEHGLFLDRRGVRVARRGKKLTWVDLYGNSHDLDYVMERGGTEEELGSPVAFIETAWRRYTKHSRNKAQEIQGAVLPLLITHRNAAPFAGAILAGVFTDGALDQLRSQGFSVLYFPYETVIGAFAGMGIDARFDEDTPENEFRSKINAWEGLSPQQRKAIADGLLDANRTEVERFMQSLEATVTRQVAFVRIMAVHGMLVERASIEEAITFIQEYHEEPSPQPFVKYEVEVTYNNGNKINGQFQDKASAVQFLRDYAPPAPKALP
jgi:hypothetical protein